MCFHRIFYQELLALFLESQISKPQNTAWLGAWKRVIEKITLLELSEFVDSHMQEWVRPEKPFVLAFVNAHAMNLVAASEVFAKDLIQADVLVRDGTGMEKLFRMLRLSPGVNLNGTDLIPRLIPLFEGKKIALLGTQEPFLTNARIKILNELAPDSEIHVMDGFRSESDYISFCVRVVPDFVILGMGMPKQESVAKILREQLSQPCLIVCGGAIIDFLGGKVVRAPAWVRSYGVEWLYRLLLEPRRLFKRYVIGNPMFMLRARKYTNANLLAINKSKKRI